MIFKRFSGDITSAAQLLPLGKKLVTHVQNIGVNYITRRYPTGKIKVLRVGENYILDISGESNFVFWEIVHDHIYVYLVRVKKNLDMSISRLGTWEELGLEGGSNWAISTKFDGPIVAGTIKELEEFWVFTGFPNDSGIWFSEGYPVESARYVKSGRTKSSVKLLPESIPPLRTSADNQDITVINPGDTVMYFPCNPYFSIRHDKTPVIEGGNGFMVFSSNINKKESQSNSFGYTNELDNYMLWKVTKDGKEQITDRLGIPDPKIEYRYTESHGNDQESFLPEKWARQVCIDEYCRLTYPRGEYWERRTGAAPNWFTANSKYLRYIFVDSYPQAINGIFHPDCMTANIPFLGGGWGQYDQRDENFKMVMGDPDHEIAERYTICPLGLLVFHIMKVDLESGEQSYEHVFNSVTKFATGYADNIDKCLVTGFVTLINDPSNTYAGVARVISDHAQPWVEPSLYGQGEDDPARSSVVDSIPYTRDRNLVQIWINFSDKGMEGSITSNGFTLSEVNVPGFSANWFLGMSQFWLVQHYHLWTAYEIACVYVKDLDRFVVHGENFILHCKSDGSDVKVVRTYPAPYGLYTILTIGKNVVVDGKSVWFSICDVPDDSYLRSVRNFSVNSLIRVDLETGDEVAVKMSEKFNYPVITDTAGLLSL